MQAEQLHEAIERRLALTGQRYTSTRRQVVDAMATLGHPATTPEIVARAGSIPQSSVYRTIALLIDAAVLVKVPGHDVHGRVELAEDLTGHHHHLVCSTCGAVNDIAVTARLEHALAEAAAAVAELGYDVTGHRFDLIGVCPNCRVEPEA